VRLAVFPEAADAVGMHPDEHRAGEILAANCLGMHGFALTFAGQHVVANDPVRVVGLFVRNDVDDIIRTGEPVGDHGAQSGADDLARALSPGSAAAACNCFLAVFLKYARTWPASAASDGIGWESSQTERSFGAAGVNERSTIGSFVAELQVLVEEVVHEFPAHLIVIVGELDEGLGHHVASYRKACRGL